MVIITIMIVGVQFCPTNIFLEISFIFRERGRVGERERNIDLLPLTCAPTGDSSRHVPWLGIEPASFHFVGWCPTNWATPVRAHLTDINWALTMFWALQCMLGGKGVKKRGRKIKLANQWTRTDRDEWREGNNRVDMLDAAWSCRKGGGSILLWMDRGGSLRRWCGSRDPGRLLGKTEVWLVLEVGLVWGRKAEYGEEGSRSEVIRSEVGEAGLLGLEGYRQCWGRGVGRDFK